MRGHTALTLLLVRTGLAGRHALITCMRHSVLPVTLWTRFLT